MLVFLQQNIWLLFIATIISAVVFFALGCAAMMSAFGPSNENTLGAKVFNFALSFAFVLTCVSGCGFLTGIFMQMVHSIAKWAG